MGPKGEQGVAQGAPGSPKWCPKVPKVMPQGAKRVPQGVKMEPADLPPRIKKSIPVVANPASRQASGEGGGRVHANPVTNQALREGGGQPFCKTSNTYSVLVTLCC